MKKNLIIILSIVFIFSACKNDVVTVNTDIEDSSQSEHLLSATAWFQQSAEMQAAFYQAFNYAKNQLIRNAEMSTSGLPKAVVVDIDETMLDNSPFEVYLIQNNKSFTKELWTEWVNLAKAEPLPGAIDFTVFAKENEVTVFYISNRHVDNIDATVKNLQEKGFAFANIENVILKDSTSDKTERRSIVSENYEIIMLIGDNLRDFDEVFSDRTSNYGHNVVEENIDYFGTKYIVLPNPMYGQWEKAYKNTDGDTSHEQKLKNMRDNLIGY